MLRNTYLGPFKRATLVLRHCMMWARSSSADVFIKNPNFNPDTIPAEKTSVYCVHGTADRNESFSLIVDRLKDGLPPNVDGCHLLSFNGEINGAGIEEFAIQLKDKILINSEKGNRVILMGHSRGGLIASWFAENLASENGIQVDLVACISSPFRGSYLAMAPLTVVSKSVGQMRVESDFVKSLSEKIAASNINYLFAGAEKDAIVSENAWLPYSKDPNDENCMLLTGHCHLSIMSSHELVRWMSDKIRSVYEGEILRPRQVMF